MSTPYWSVGTCTHEKEELVYVGTGGASVMLSPAAARVMAQALLAAAELLDDGDAA